MDHSSFNSHVRPAFAVKALAATILAGVAISAAAQQPPSNSVQVQRKAMRKLVFLAGAGRGQ